MGSAFPGCYLGFLAVCLAGQVGPSAVLPCCLVPAHTVVVGEEDIFLEVDNPAVRAHQDPIDSAGVVGPVVVVTERFVLAVGTEGLVVAGNPAVDTLAAAAAEEEDLVAVDIQVVPVVQEALFVVVQAVAGNLASWEDILLVEDSHVGVVAGIQAVVRCQVDKDHLVAFFADPTRNTSFASPRHSLPQKRRQSSFLQCPTNQNWSTRKSAMPQPLEKQPSLLPYQ